MVINDITLSSLKCGETATVKYLDSTANLYNRFQELGVVKGTKIRKVLVSPLGDPSAYYVRGALIAIRDCDAASVFVDGGTYYE